MIKCKKVSFSYPPNETDIGDREGHGTLRNIDLSINDGDFVLLCGTSGCGKTTLTRHPKAGKTGLRAVEPYKSTGQKCFLPFRWGKAKNRLWICRRCGTGYICFGRAIFQP